MSKSILVTGASKGIGAEIVRKFWSENDSYTNFVLVARESEEFDLLEKELILNNKNNKKIFKLIADFSDRDDIERLVNRINSEGINIDCLVNNAGYTKPEPIHLIDISDFDKTLNVNLISPFLLVQGLLKKGNKFELIVNMASTAGINGRAGWLTYSASKSAMINMSEVMREELRIYGTRVVCLAPGRCATGLRKVLAPDEDPSTIMQPEHVASVVHMLSSDIGKYIDSQHLVVRL